MASPFDAATPQPDATPQDTGNPWLSLPRGPGGTPMLTVTPSAAPSTQVQPSGGGATPPVNNTQQVPYVAGASQGQNPTVNIDKSVPRYDKRLVDQDGIPADLYKYLSVHETTEKALMQKGMSYDDAHAQATAAEKNAVTSDGYDWKTYESIMDGYAAHTEQEKNAQTPSQLYTQPYQQEGQTGLVKNTTEQQQPQGTQPPPPQNTNEPTADQLQQQIVQSRLRADRVFGGVTDFLRPLNESFYEVAKPWYAMKGLEENAINEALGHYGLDFMNDKAAISADPEQLFKLLGLDKNPPNSYSYEAGKMVWSTLATSMALYWGASYAAARAAAPPILNAAPSIGTGIGDLGNLAVSGYGNYAKLAAEQYSKAILANPAMHFVADQFASLGATMGGLKAGDYAKSQGLGPWGQLGANTLGSIVGGVGGVGAMMGAKAVAKPLYGLSKFAAKRLTDAVDAVAQEFGLYRRMTNFEARKPGPVMVNDQDLDNARKAETLARNASDAVVAARLYRDQQTPGTEPWEEANLHLQDRLADERSLHTDADKFWDKIPAAVRGKYSRQQSAIRAEFADTVYPKQFAQDQVQGELQVINDAVQQAYERMEPSSTLSMAEQSAKLSDGIWQARRLGKAILDKFWARTPINQPLPNRSILKALNGFAKSLEGKFTEAQIPTDKFQELREAMGDIRKPLPTLNWLKNFMTEVHESADKAYAAGDARLGANLDRFHSMLFNEVARMYPNDVTLQQARAVSKQYFDLFTRGELGDILTKDRQGVPAVHPEDVLGQLMSRARGLRDLSTAVKWLGKARMASTTGKSTSTVLGPGEQAQLKQLQEQAVQSIKSYIQDYIKRYEGDPAKVNRLLGDPAFQQRIKPYANIAGQVRLYAGKLADLMDRRFALEKSALAKYAEADPDKALDMVWSAKDPAAMAKALMNGTAGVGGFASDPIALDGFKGGLIDRFVAKTNADPTKMVRMLTGPQGRLLKTVLSPGEYTRLENLVTRFKQISDVYVKESKLRNAKILLIQMLSLKLLAKAPEWMKAGEGGQLKQASLVAGFAKETAEKSLEKIDPKEMFRLAISNPEFEQMLFRSIPTDVKDGKEFVSAIERTSAFEWSAMSVFRNWLMSGQGPGPHDVAEATDQIFANAIPSAQAGELVPFPGYPGDAEARMLQVQGLKNTMVDRNPSASSEAINSAFDQYFSGRMGGAKVLSMGPEAYNRWLERNGQRPR